MKFVLVISFVEWCLAFLPSLNRKVAQLGAMLFLLHLIDMLTVIF